MRGSSQEAERTAANLSLRFGAGDGPAARLEGRLPPVHEQERDGGICADALVAVDEWVVLTDVKEVGRRWGLPILSADTKKRELTGNFKNSGAKWDRSPVLVNDHDFRCDSTGVGIPYGIYDLLANRGAMFVGVSHDTPCFAAHSIAQWWRREGADRYAGARQLLILGDTGTSKWNPVEHGLFSEISKNWAGEPLASYEQRQMAHHNSP